MITNLSNTRVGIVTHNGMLFCQKCSDTIIVNYDSTMDDGGTPVYADAYPHNVERCDGCGKVVLKSWLEDFLDGVCEKAARNLISASEARVVVNDTTEAVEAILKNVK